MSDPQRSLLQTQHPQLADEVKRAIGVMEKVLQIAGPLPGTVDESGSNAGILATGEFADPSATATSDSQASFDTDGKYSHPDDTPTLAVGEAFGRYQIVKILGKGAMGAVYLAYDARLERHVAIKIPLAQRNPIALERFYVEARATATLRSPNICPVYDVAQINGVHYISMAFIDGRPLSKVIDVGPMSPEQAASIIARTARGIQKAHERGVVHRDIKPDNIMIDTDGEPVVMDFGLAWRDGGSDARLTQHGALLGSPAYMSPEQAMGKQELIGPATDVYSLGVVLYQMLTQRLPFEGSIMSVLKQITSDAPSPPSTHIPAIAGSPIEQICMRMIEKSPSDRYPCMGDVAEATEQCQAPPPPDGRSKGAWRFFKRLGRRSQ